MNKIAVIYLSYIPYGTNYLELFLDSYKNNIAGIEHDLIIVFNGYVNEDEITPFLFLLANSSIEYHIQKTTSKYDIDVYYYITNKYNNYLYFLYLNTYSNILHKNWLLYFYNNINQNNVGCVSATGAWGDFDHRMEYNKSIKQLLSFNINIKSLKKVIYFRFNFYPTVGIHLRTNAFIIQREIFLNIKRPKVKPYFLSFFLGLNKKKLRSFCFEHGDNSFTKQLIKKGYKIKIINKLGLAYDIENWAKSNIFWNGDQENLLIQDNQTSKYSNASLENQKKMRFTAWGI